MKTILVVEDDPVNAHVLREFLGAYGYRAIVADDGRKGVALFEAERPDLVIIDVLLPYKNGYDVFDEVRASSAGKQTPVFMMSAIFEEIADVHAHRPAERRAQAYFTKPFDLHTLIDHVEFYAGALGRGGGAAAAGRPGVGEREGHEGGRAGRRAQRGGAWRGRDFNYFVFSVLRARVLAFPSPRLHVNSSPTEVD